VNSISTPGRRIGDDRHPGGPAPPEYAALYPYLVAGEWQPAAVAAGRVIANILGRPLGRFIIGERALDPAHFEFRGSPPRPNPGCGGGGRMPR
jgi:hypothetical protein